MALSKDTEKKLLVREADSWNEVVTKALSLRDLGRTADAKRAFRKYGELFSDKDPGAGKYALVAQAFTDEMKKFGVRRGAYIYSVTPRRGG